MSENEEFLKAKQTHSQFKAIKNWKEAFFTSGRVGDKIIKKKTSD
jgi:hypothetical protein